MRVCTDGFDLFYLLTFDSLFGSSQILPKLSSILLLLKFVLSVPLEVIAQQAMPTQKSQSFDRFLSFPDQRPLSLLSLSSKALFEALPFQACLLEKGIDCERKRNDPFLFRASFVKPKGKIRHVVREHRQFSKKFYRSN